MAGPGQRAHYISRRGEICEALAPYVAPAEFRDGEDTELGGYEIPTQLDTDSRGQKKSPQQTKSFAAATAEVTGESKSTINQYRAIGDALGEDALRVGGTSLDKKAELTALAKMPAEQRAPLIARAIAGEKVTARAPAPPPAAPPPSLALPPTPPRHIRGAGAGRRHALQQSSFGHPCHAGA